MSKVYVTTYEIIGEGAAKAATYYTEVDAARKMHWQFVNEVGGEGLRPGHNGGVRSVMFKTLPAGWRKIGRAGDNIEAVPHRGSAAGKALAKRLADLPKVPQPHVLAEAFGYNPNEMAMDGERGVIYFPTELRVSHPAPRSFLRLPRFERDGFSPDETMLRAIPESEFMDAVERHNSEARRQRERRAA